jgi:hypothetical protein
MQTSPAQAPILHDDREALRLIERIRRKIENKTEKLKPAEASEINERDKQSPRCLFS